MRTSRVVRRAGAALLCLSLLATACTSDEGSDDDGPAGSSAPAGTVLGDGDAYEATIVRTDGGVPHITAEDLPSLSFGQGWASGEDHACDLADQIVKIEGERARWFGPGEEDANIDSDYAWRSIGIRDIAEEDWADAPTEVVELITAYADGWNAHLAEVGSDGLSDWCAGEEWVRPLEPVEVYAYARSITLLASSGAVADYIATAQPPAATEGAAPDGTDEQSMGPVEPVEPVTASNGWAIGSERSADGGGMLVANPHFPWEGQLRFWEVHLTIPGELDIYGVNLSGLPGIAIGFTEQFGWTHTVSAGSRFTAYRLDLVPGTPTSYRYGDEVKEMTSEDVTIEVLGDDGARAEQTRTMWRSHYGPVLDFPGVGWSDATTIAIRDANIDNDEFIEQYLAMMQADDLDELIAINEDITGVPLFNTIATSADGRAWYADTAATPNLSDEAIAAYDASLLTDPIAKVAADSGAILLDGSDPTFEWVEVDGARDPGLVPYSEMPVLERDDYVFNANDSFWVAHAEELLEGDYSPLHGRQGTARSPRTRENATVLSDTTAEGPSGEDGTFTLDELAAAAGQNRGYTSRALLDEVVERCSAAGPVELPALPGDDTTEGLPAATVDVAEACAVLAGWDGTYDLDRAGPPIWRELMNRYEPADLTGNAGVLWESPFDATDPIGTPSGLAPAADGGADTLLENLARAVQVIEAGGLGVDVTLGEVQVAIRNGTLVPIHGGDAGDGTTNIVGWSGASPILDPSLLARERVRVAPGADLSVVTDGDTTTTGYVINNGTSFMMALAYTDDGPQAKAFLTYGNTSDRSDPAYTEATQRFSDKEWRTVLFRADDVAAGAIETTTVRG
jgi:acyl-homoserine-lactone acylase